MPYPTGKSGTKSITRHLAMQVEGFMKNALSLSAVLLLLGIGVLAHAQKTTQPNTQPEAQAAAGQTPVTVARISAPPNAHMDVQANTQRENLPQAPSYSLLSRLNKGSAASGRPVSGPIVNGRPYVKPNEHMLVADYLHDTYGLPGIARTTVRALYSEGRGKPTGWGTDAAGFGQRFGSSAAVTAINGTVRFGFENALHEDLRYIPCHGCRAKQKIENALLSEITARHGADGHRAFSLTPTIADMSGPIISHTLWYPGNSGGPLEGAITARTVFATRIGAHLFEEFVWERRHKDVHGEVGSRLQ